MASSLADDSNPTGHLILSKGAFDNVLAVCTSLQRNDTEVPLTHDALKALRDFYQAKGNAGFRVLAVAMRRIAAKAATMKAG